jgi:hypothetical protein
MVSAYPMVSGANDDINGEWEVIGYDEVGRRHVRHRRTGHRQVVPPKGGGGPMLATPLNPNQGGASAFTMPGQYAIMASGQRKQYAAFTSPTAVAAGAVWTSEADVQKGFQATRIVMEAHVDASGADARGFVRIDTVNVGQRNQSVSPGVFSNSLFDPLAYQLDVLLDPASTGNKIILTGALLAAAPGPCTIKFSAVGGASL